MIPKKIHYCWFGGKEKPKSVKKCIKSWKKFCPDYEVVEWNETNFDMNFNAYVKEAYDSKKWAFVSDVARLYALVNFGGIYMDTDVELIKNPDNLLEYKAVSGFETDQHIMTGFIASEKGFPLFDELLHGYDGAHFIKEDGSPDLTPNVERMTKLCLENGLVLNDTFQIVNDFALFPHVYFSPKDHNDGKIYKTEDTVAIHHFAASWTSARSKIRTKLVRISYALLGHRITDSIRRKFGNLK